MGESSRSKPDEYDSTTDYHYLKFENRCLRGSGDDFQKLFEDIMVRDRPGEFERVRPYGRFGDRKCDGLIESEGIVFQVYSPDELKQAEVQKKIDEDLEGAVQHWSDILKKWVFVYNAKRGTPPDIQLTLQQKQKQYPNIEIDCWSNDYLWEITRELSLQQRSEILGAPPQWNVEQPKTAYIPSLPFHLLKRSTDLDTLKNLVLSSSIQSTGITRSTLKIGVYGMGGIGKSVLAAMLARDPEIRAAFPDGIFWITLGQEPILTLRQLDLAQILGDASLPFQDVQQGKIHLSQLLGDRTCLLILDDVWNIEHLAAFDILSDQSSLLFTTQHSRIVKTFNAFEHQVHLLNDDDALELLAACSGQYKETLPIEAHEIVKECGNLPLALSMIGAIAKARPNRWDNLLHKLQNANLDKIRHQFPDYPYPDLLKAIQVSVDALEREVKVRYLDFAVFREDVAIPECTLQTFWKTEELDEYDTQDVIDMLVERSLAQRDEVGNLSLHNLQYSYVKSLIANMPALHNKLLHAYTNYCPQGWHSYLKSDNYFFENLAYHLQKAEKEDELYALLAASPDWMQIKFKRYQNYISYVADLELALDGFVDPLRIERLYILVRIQTARHIVYGWGNRYTNIDLDTLVWLGRKREAEGYAELRASDEGKFYSSLAICQALHEKGDLDNAHMSKIFHVLVDFLTDANKKYKHLLIELSLFLVQAKLIAYFGFVYETIKLFGSQELLLVLLVFLIESGESKRTDELLKIAEETISRKTSDIEKLKIYCNLTLALFNANYIDEANDFLSKIRRFIKEIYLDDVETRTEALLEFAKFLSFLNLERYIEEANQYFIEIKETIFNLEEYGTKSYLLQELANSLSELGRFDEAKELVYSIPESTSYRSDALSRLANALGKNGYSNEASILLNKATGVRYITGKWHHDGIVELVNILKSLTMKRRAKPF